MPPNGYLFEVACWTIIWDMYLKVGLPWLEQGTSVLSGLRSNQLSYKPRKNLSSAVQKPLKSDRMRIKNDQLDRPRMNISRGDIRYP